MRVSRLFPALFLCGAAACRPLPPPVVGDANARLPNQPSVVDLVATVLDSLPGGPPIRIVPRTMEAGAADQDRESRQAERFAGMPGLVGVVGHAGSRGALLASRVYNAAGVPQVVPNATTRHLRSAGPWTFMLAPDDAVTAGFLARYAVDSLRAQRIAMLYVGDEYGVGMRDGAVEALAARGLALVDAVLVPEVACQTDAGLLVQRSIMSATLRRSRPDLLILAVETQFAACLMRLTAAVAPAVRYLLSDAVVPTAPIVRELPSDVRRRATILSFWSAGRDSVNRAFLARSERLLGRAPLPHEALTYDAFLLVAHAVREVGPSRPAVRAWLESLGRTRPPFPGVAGPIAFDGTREILRVVPLVEAER